jgi:predicted kinase
MRALPIVAITTVLVLTTMVAGAADSRTYDRPLESTWDEAIKAVRDADLVVIDSDRSEHRFTMRTQAWHSHKKGRVIEVELSGNDLTTTVTARAADPSEAVKLAKAIALYFQALDERMN